MASVWLKLCGFNDCDSNINIGGNLIEKCWSDSVLCKMFFKNKQNVYIERDVSKNHFGMQEVVTNVLTRSYFEWQMSRFRSSVGRA